MAEHDRCQHSDDPDHASPPARSASRALTRAVGLRPSIPLYHDSRLAAAIMSKIPNRLTDVCSSGPPENWVMMNWPAKARNTPRQKISSECWPQRTAGSKNGDFKPGQSRGTKRTVTAASARKWAKRRTSRLVLSMGYSRSLSQVGTSRSSGSKRHVKVMAKANKREATATASTTRQRSTPASRCAPPSAHQAPNTNSNCQAKGLKNHTPFV